MRQETFTPVSWCSARANCRFEHELSKVVIVGIVLFGDQGTSRYSDDGRTGRDRGRHNGVSTDADAIAENDGAKHATSCAQEHVITKNRRIATPADGHVLKNGRVLTNARISRNHDAHRVGNPGTPAQLNSGGNVDREQVHVQPVEQPAERMKPNAAETLRKTKNQERMPTGMEKGGSKKPAGPLNAPRFESPGNVPPKIAKQQ